MNFERLKPHFPWITLAVLVVVVSIIDPTFLRPSSLLSLAGDIVPLFIMALGITFVIYIGGIDLSAQSMANMVTVLATVWLASLGAWVAVAVVLVGAALGAFSGYVTTRLVCALIHIDFGCRRCGLFSSKVDVGSEVGIDGCSSA